MAGEEQELSGGVIELIHVHRLHERDLIGDLLEVRDGVAHPESALAVLLEGTRGTHELRLMILASVIDASAIAVVAIAAST